MRVSDYPAAQQHQDDQGTQGTTPQIGMNRFSIWLRRYGMTPKVYMDAELTTILERIEGDIGTLKTDTKTNCRKITTLTHEVAKLRTQTKVYVGMRNIDGGRLTNIQEGVDATQRELAELRDIHTMVQANGEGIEILGRQIDIIEDRLNQNSQSDT